MVLHMIFILPMATTPSQAKLFKAGDGESKFSKL
jgi:hypothetical protein